MLNVVAASAAGGGAVAVGVTVIATLVVSALLVVLVSLVRTARALRHAAQELYAESQALLVELGSTVAQAGTELDRVDDLIGAAESITTTVGSASRLAYVALANPVIKVMAFGSGTARASERLRRRHGPDRR